MSLNATPWKGIGGGCVEPYDSTEFIAKLSFKKHEYGQEFKGHVRLCVSK